MLQLSNSKHIFQKEFLLKIFLKHYKMKAKWETEELENPKHCHKQDTCSR